MFTLTNPHARRLFTPYYYVQSEGVKILSPMFFNGTNSCAINWYWHHTSQKHQSSSTTHFPWREGKAIL